MTSGTPDDRIGLGQRAARGAFVTFGGQGLRIMVQVLSVTVLARLLGPSDYGLIAMVSVIVGIGEIFRDFGLSSAAVQAPHLSHQQRDNLFWVNTGIGVLLATVVFSSAALVAQVYGRTELVGITRALSVTFLLNGMATQFRADRIRNLKFVHLAIADVSSPTIALGVAVALALNGSGYWALVAQSLTQSFVLLVVLALSGRWLPQLPHRNTPMRGLLRFGWRLVGTQLIGYAANNTDQFIIGLRFGAGDLGFYNRAFSLLMTPLSQLRAPTTTVALPVLSRLHDDDVRYAAFVRRGQLALGYTLVAGLGLVASAAEPITVLFLGHQWDTVTPILRLIAIAGIFQTLAYVGYWIYLSRSLTAELLRYSLLTGLIKMACVILGSHWGVVGVATGYMVAASFEWPLSLWWLSRRTTIPLGALMTGALRILGVVVAAGVPAAAAVHALDSQRSVVQLAAALAVTLASYGVLTLVVPTVRRDLTGVVGIVRMAISRKGLS